MVDYYQSFHDSILKSSTLFLNKCFLGTTIIMSTTESNSQLNFSEIFSWISQKFSSVRLKKCTRYYMHSNIFITFKSSTIKRVIFISTRNMHFSYKILLYYILYGQQQTLISFNSYKCCSTNLSFHYKSVFSAADDVNHDVKS